MKIIPGILIAVIFLLYIVSFSKGINFNKISEDKFKSSDSLKAKKKGGSERELGIGPIKQLKLGSIDKKLADEGKNIFNIKCSECHDLDKKVEGPPLRPLVKKIPPVYLMNYLLNTEEMQKKDKQLKKLIKEYNGEEMPDQQLQEHEARALLEYFRTVCK